MSDTGPRPGSFEDKAARYPGFTLTPDERIPVDAPLERRVTRRVMPARERTIYADRAELYSRLMAKRTVALQKKMNARTKAQTEYWTGRSHAFEEAAELIRDWAGETAPEPGDEQATAVT